MRRRRPRRRPRLVDAEPQSVAQLDEVAQLALVEGVADMAVDRVDVGERHTTEEREALLRDRDDRAAAVFGVVRLRDEATGCEAVDAGGSRWAA